METKGSYLKVKNPEKVHDTSSYCEQKPVTVYGT